MLDDDKRELGKVSQKEPEKFGRLKQRALDLGMSTEEFILHAANAPTKQQEVTEISEIKQSIKELSNITQQLRNGQQPQVMQPQIPFQPPPPDLLSQAQNMASLISTIKEMFPQQKLTDAISMLRELKKN